MQKLKDLKLYYSRTILYDYEDKGIKTKGIKNSASLQNVDKHLVFYSTCLALLSRLKEPSYIETKILHVDNTIYDNIKAEIKLPDLQETHDYIRVVSGVNQIALIIRPEKYKEKDENGRLERRKENEQKKVTKGL